MPIRLNFYVDVHPSFYAESYCLKCLDFHFFGEHFLVNRNKCDWVPFFKKYFLEFSIKKVKKENKTKVMQEGWPFNLAPMTLL